jgi:hypothetical protein
MHRIQMIFQTTPRRPGDRDRHGHFGSELSRERRAPFQNFTALNSNALHPGGIIVATSTASGMKEPVA